MVEEKDYLSLLSNVDLNDQEKVLFHLTTLAKWANGEIQKVFCGNFLVAIINNDLIAATLTADSVNIKYLPVYATFMYKLAPTGRQQ